MVTATGTDEKALVEAAQGGDREAFLALYEAYATPIFDFCYRMVRNRTDAEDVTSDVFLKAMERLGSLRDPAAFKGWLYQVARNAALSHIEARGKVTPVPEYHETAQAEKTQTLPLPEARVEERDLQRLVWDAAATLNPRDYSVFELAVRHGLGSKEIAQALDVRPAYAYILTNRLKSSVAEALEALLLVRAGRTSCLALDDLVTSYGDEPTPRLRKAVSRHARSCDVCTESKKRRASVPALLQGTAFAEPASAFKDALRERLRDGWKAPTMATGTTLATIVASVLSVVVAAGVLVGALAQRTITETDEFPGQEFPAQEDFPTEGIEDVLSTPGPSVPPQPRSQPTPGVVIVIDGTDQGDEAVETEEPEEPTQTQPPPSRPPRTPPPTIN